MFERFTDRARKVMALAHQEAQRFNNEYIGTEHILLGLVKEGSGKGSAVLKNLDVDIKKLRIEVEIEVEKLVKSGSDMVTMGKLPQTPRAKKAIEYAIEETRDMMAKLNRKLYLGTEHILLGLLREEEGIGAQVLMNLGLELEDVRQEVLNLLEVGVNEAPREEGLEPMENVSGGPICDICGSITVRNGTHYKCYNCGNSMGCSLENAIPITLLIDPGDATAEELSELFVELSTLYRMVGGSGVNFTIVDAKETAVA